MHQSVKLSSSTAILADWILGAVVFGVVLGWLVLSAVSFLDRFSVGTTSVPIAIGFIVTMYPRG